MKNRCRSGRIQERKVTSHLQDLGWTNLRRSKGSRGPADLSGRTPGGYKAYVQVKSGTATVSRREIRALRALARARGGLAVTAERNKGSTKFKFRGRWK